MGAQEGDTWPPVLSCAHYFQVPATQASLNTTLHSCFFSNINRFADFVLGKFVPPSIQTSVKFRHFEECIFISFQQITFKLGNYTNFKTLFPVVSTDFP